ncbi:MAG TPA: 4-hydroxy-3-methylbut-2-enyl diphosphate reductase [Lachnospiraceae bacterium]|nr:4-hydroxy-3-methylbut-2-enyl diphosphate reductase [Lachnospiraceae bacterium]
MEEDRQVRERIDALRERCQREDSPDPPGSGELRGNLWVSPDGLCALYQAKSAGFCFGVQRAVDQVYEQIESGAEPIYTFGPIIHNEIVVNDLEEKGVKVLRSEAELETLRKGSVVIRSHGVGRDVYARIQKNGLKAVDATCPFVRKIHRIVEEKGREGYEVVIIGSASHPEVEGIRGWSTGEVTVVETEEDARSFVPKTDKPLCVVSQTTFNLKKFHKFVEIIKGLRYHEIAVLNTICNATEERQTEARSIARCADVMFVIGGEHSSNTQKLYEICRKECHDTFFVQTFDDLNLRLVPFRGIVGISAGASTPNILIEEVSNLCRKTILSRC